jgi:hypothetical protein
MEHEITVKYTLETIEASVWHQWLNLIGRSGFLLLIVLIIVFSCLLFIGTTRWLTGFFAAVLLIYGGIIAFGYFRLRAFSMTRFRKMESPTATFRFNDKGVSVEADTGGTEIAWKLVDKILQTPKVWIILVAGGGMTLPTDALTDELKAFILERAAI